MTREKVKADVIAKAKLSGQGEEVAAALERHEKLMQEKKDMGKAIGGDVKERIAD